MSTAATTPTTTTDAPATSVRRLLQKTGAEAVGTFAMVFAGCGAIVVNAQFDGAISHLGVSLTFGLVIGVMIYAVGHLSGAHFNPAVTVAFASLGAFSWRQVPVYAAGQTAAAILAALALRSIVGTEAGLGATLPAAQTGVAGAFVLEVILTAILMFVITAVATDSRALGHMAGLAIGGTVALNALWAGPLTGASMNPARSIGPALVAGRLDALWLYLAAPVCGAILGGWTYRLIRCSPEPEGPARGCC